MGWGKKFRNILKNFVLIVLAIILGIVTLNLPTINSVKAFAEENMVKKIVNIKVTRGMESLELENGSEYYERKINSENKDTIEKWLKQAREDTSTVFDINGEHKVDIVIFNSEDEFMEALKININDVAAIYLNDTIYMYKGSIKGRNIIHEYTHHIVNYYCKENDINKYNIPTWFEEGIAEYTSMIHNEGELIYVVDIDKKVDFRNLGNSNKEISDMINNGYNVYGQSYLVIKEIVKEKGIDVIMNILNDSKNMEFYDAFEKNAGKSIEDIVDNLKEI
ncbi:peptidase MA family metallohydrolase [Clostridium sardiniense]|uniref:peptidase MA family metallohydrolase n=1 Tax=Clostridium sardiniense TaxID=29369 RepID=UPI003D32514C